MGEGCIRFDSDKIRTLVSIARDSSHMFIMEESSVVTFPRLFFILSGNEDIHEGSD